MNNPIAVTSPCLLLRWIFSVTVMFSILAPTGAWCEQPSAVVRKLNAALLEAMKKGKEAGYPVRRSIVEPVIRDSFALDDTARAAAGRYWATFNEDQRKIYLKTYADWTVATYAGRFDGYSGEKFTIVSESPPVGGTVTVISKLIQPKGGEVEFSYQLRQVRGNWRIADIKICGVSQLALTRGQFISIVRKKGFPGLIAKLNEKIDKLAQGVVD